MPTYEYKCDACGFEFERFQPISADPVKKCPQCGKSKVKKLISAGAGLIFKGSGFYITDYREQGYKDSAKNDAAAAGGTGDKAAASGGDGAAAAAAKGEAKAGGDAKPAAEAKPAETKAPESKPSGGASKSSGGSSSKSGKSKK